jgi:hypothetical protein
MSLICPDCGVELEATMKSCPLCNFSDFERIQNTDEFVPIPEPRQKSNTLSEYVKLNPVQKRKLFWELSGIVLISATLVTMIINFVSSNAVTWSKYTITACLVLFAIISLLSFLRHRLFLLLCGSFSAASLLLILFDLYGENAGWGIQLAVPLLFSMHLMIYLFVVIVRITRHHGFNVLAWFIIAAGIFAICTEGILGHYMNGAIAFHWSLIVAVCLIPVSAILFYIHYRLKKGIELKQFFHI